MFSNLPEYDIFLIIQIAQKSTSIGYLFSEWLEVFQKKK